MSQKPIEPDGRASSWHEVVARMELVGPVFRALTQVWRAARFLYVSDLASPFWHRWGAVFVAIWFLVLARAGIFGYGKLFQSIGEFGKISGFTQITFYLVAICVTAVLSLLLSMSMKRANTLQCFFAGLLLTFFVVVVFLPRLNDINFGSN